jgi:Flp pilus assembly protein TadB
MAEITKLSVGQAIDKLRGTDAPKAKMARLDEKIDVLDEEAQRLRAMRRRLERDQRASSTGRDAQETNGRDAQKGNARHVTKLKILGIIIGIVIVMTILAWTWGLL